MFGRDSGLKLSKPRCVLDIRSMVLWSFCTGVRHKTAYRCAAVFLPAVQSAPGKQVTDAGKYGDAPPKQERGVTTGISSRGCESRRFQHRVSQFETFLTSNIA